MKRYSERHTAYYHDELGNDDSPYVDPYSGHIPEARFSSIMVNDVYSGVSYRPNLDNDVMTDKQKSVEALSLYNAMNNSMPFLVKACEVLGLVPVYHDIDTLKSLIHYKLTAHDKSRYIDTFIQLAKEWNDRVAKKAKNPTVGIRWAHMITNTDAAVSINKSMGANWDEDAYKKLKLKEPGEVVVLNNQYACTLFDDNTILVYDRKYKPEEPGPIWTEDDFVTSQLNWNDDRTIWQHITTFIYNMLRPILVVD